MKNKKVRMGITVILALFVITGAVVIPRMWQESSTGQGDWAEVQTAGAGEEKHKIYQSLSEPDRQTAGIYAELYETSQEEVAALYIQTNDWEKAGEALEKQFFTIPENTKYQMEEDGYSLEDIEEAEKLSAKAGIRAAELIQAKGRASEGKSWAEVKKEKGIGE